MTPRVLVVLAGAVALASPGDAGHEFAWEGFEREIDWHADTSSAATGRAVEEEIRSEGARSLKLMFKAVAKGGRAVYSRSLDADWSPYGTLVLDVYNPTGLGGLRCAVLITTTSRWLAHEYRLPPLAPGWNRDLAVDLKSKRFICAASDYRPAGHLVARDEMRSVGFVVYPGAVAEGSLAIDNIRLRRAGIVTAGPLSLNTTFDLTSSGGNLDYLPPDMRVRPADVLPLESFESGATWTGGHSGIVVEPVSDLRSHGRNGLGVTFPASPDGFALHLVGLEGRLAGSRQLRMDIHCAGPEASVRLTLEDNDGNTYDSSWKFLRHGWNTPVFDFTNQAAWEGTVIDERILGNLAAVTMTVSSRYPGRLVFDGLSVSSIRLSSATRGGTVLSLSYNPLPALEFTGDWRVEDTVYGNSPSSLRSAGAETYLDAGVVRLDAGPFRTRALYRKRVNRMDQPMYLLVSPDRLGEEIAGVETAGHLLGTEIQALVASRLEYDRYSSRRPTGFGPEGLGILRLRRNVTPDTRIGATHVTHLSRYGRGVQGVPRNRQTWGLDLENRAPAGPVTLNSSIEGAVTGGDAFRDENANAPPSDRYYFSTYLSPEWGRLNVRGYYCLVGYDFDASFMSWGGNYDEYGAGGDFNLEDLSVLEGLTRLPLYDRSLSKNLVLGWNYFDFRSRDRRLSAAGELEPRLRGRELDIELGNDSQAKPSFSFGFELDGREDQWYRSTATEWDARVRLPVAWDVVAASSAAIGRERETDRETGESGRGWTRRCSAGLERYFSFNLFLSASSSWSVSHERWEEDWGDPARYHKLAWTARQTIGANTVIELAYGQPALLGYDFGVQETLDVYTLTLRSYF